MHTCSSCSRVLPEIDFYSYVLKGSLKRIRDKRCKACRKVLTQAVHRRDAAALIVRKAERIKQAIADQAGDPFYKPVDFSTWR